MVEEYSRVKFKDELEITYIIEDTGDDVLFKMDTYEKVGEDERYGGTKRNISYEQYNYYVIGHDIPTFIENVINEAYHPVKDLAWRNLHEEETDTDKPHAVDKYFDENGVYIPAEKRPGYDPNKEKSPLMASIKPTMILIVIIISIILFALIILLILSYSKKK
jgi:hypothetical protein